MPRLALPVLRCSCATILLAGAASAQLADGGPLIAVPVAFTVSPETQVPGTSAPTEHTLQTKKAGFGIAFGQPAPHTPIATRPDFSFGAMFGSVTLGPGDLPYEIDAMSIGMDCTNINTTNATVEFRPEAWGAVLFAVDRNQTPSGACNPRVRDEVVGDPSGAGADVFSYVPRSANIRETRFLGTTGRALDGGEMGLSSSAARDTPQITSLDANIPRYELDSAIYAALTSDPERQEPIVYFSITQASATRPLPTWDWGTSPGGTALGPHGATILRRRWDAGSGVWVNMPPLCTFADFSGPSPELRDIDAIAYEEGNRSPTSPDGILVISYTKASTPSGMSQLLFVDLGLRRQVRDLLDSDGQPIACNAGIDMGPDEGDVVGVCIVDPIPGAQQPGSCSLELQTWSSPLPLPPPFGTIRSLDAASYRSCDPSGNTMITFHTVDPSGAPGGGTYVLGHVRPQFGTQAVARPSGPGAPYTYVFTASTVEPLSCAEWQTVWACHVASPPFQAISNIVSLRL